MNEFLRDVESGVRTAGLKYPPLNSLHEGYAMLYEEVDELWDEVRKKAPQHRDIREECVHIAAICNRIVRDVLGEVE